MSLEEHFVGLKNYQDVMKDRLFLTSLKNTTLYLVIDGVGVVVFGMLMAVALNQKLRGTSFFRTAFYIPVLVDWVIVSIVFIFILEPNFGVGQLGIDPAGYSPTKVFDQSPAGHAHHCAGIGLEGRRLLCGVLPGLRCRTFPWT